MTGRLSGSQSRTKKDECCALSQGASPDTGRVTVQFSRPPGRADANRTTEPAKVIGTNRPGPHNPTETGAVMHPPIR